MKKFRNFYYCLLASGLGENCELWERSEMQKRAKTNVELPTSNGRNEKWKMEKLTSNDRGFADLGRVDEFRQVRQWIFSGVEPLEAHLAVEPGELALGELAGADFYELDCFG